MDTNNNFSFTDLPSPVRSQLDNLKSAILHNSGNPRLRTLLFFSYSPGEGTSFITTNFARCLAQDTEFKILLIDSNSFNPCLHRICSLNGSYAYYRLRENDTNTKDLSSDEYSPNLYHISNNNQPKHFPRRFDSNHFHDFLDSAKQHFHFVIFDSSPIDTQYDSFVLSSHLDGVVIVVEAEKTPWYELKRMKKICEEKNIHILGVVLNKRRYYIPDFIYQRFLS